jgi:hypothetical protein
VGWLSDYDVTLTVTMTLGGGWLALRL